MRPQYYSVLFSFITQFSLSQDYYTVLDSVTHKPIPFVSIQLNQNQGWISNEEGRFRLRYNPQETREDSLFISCSGYKTLTLPLSEIQDSVFYLSPKAIELNAIVLSNKEVNVNQLLKAMKKKYF